MKVPAMNTPQPLPSQVPQSVSVPFLSCTPSTESIGDSPKIAKKAPFRPK